MCGLFGSVGLRLTPSQEREIVAALRGRGPDSSGKWQDTEITLLHTRLAIQDLSPLGHQPMVHSSGELVLVFNGEIYNQKELRIELEAEGIIFQSNSDTEVLLHGFRHWKNKLWSRLNGIFAVALWETKTQQLTLARDEFGIKPLLWYRNGDQCVFGSELSSFEAAELASRSRINKQALMSYSLWGSVEAPATLLEGIEVFPAGHWGQWTAQHGWELQDYEQVRTSGALPPFLNLEEASTAVEKALQASVQRQAIGDVPVGLFLSGGLDSGLLAAMLRERQDKPIHSISVGFKGLAGAVDETHQAEATAHYLGLKHRTLKVGPDVLDAHLDAFISAIDQPSIDGFNSFLVAQSAACEGMKVAFSGLGADELFGGYAHMGDTTLQQAVQARRIHGHGLSSDTKKILVEKRESLIQQGQTRQKLSLRLCSELELKGYLNNTLLRDSDAVTMHNAVELRVPFLDCDLVQLALNINEDLHRAEGPKTLLRRIAKGRLPEEVLLAPKQGFNLALGSWLLQNSRFAPQRIERLLQEHLKPQRLRISRRGFWSSWALLRATGRWGPYWRWVVLAEWLKGV